MCVKFIVLPTTNDAARRSPSAIKAESEHTSLRPLVGCPFLVAKRINSICIGQTKKKKIYNEMECFPQKLPHICCLPSLSRRRCSQTATQSFEIFICILFIDFVYSILFLRCHSIDFCLDRCERTEMCPMLVRRVRINLLQSISLTH